MQNVNFIMKQFPKGQRWKECPREKNTKATKVWENVAQTRLGGEFLECDLIAHNTYCFGKHARTLNISGKTLARFVDVLLKLTGQSSVSGSRAEPYLKNFACKGGLCLTLLRGNLLACKQGLRKLQVPFSVHPLTLVKLCEVLTSNGIKKGIIGCKRLGTAEPR